MFPILIDVGSEMVVISEEVTRELNIGWKHANWKMITVDGNRSDLTNMVECVPDNVDSIVILIQMSEAQSCSEYVMLGHPCDTYAQKNGRNLVNRNRHITISAINASEQVTFVTMDLGDKRDRFHSSSGNLFTYLKSRQLGRIGPGTTKNRGWRFIGGMIEKRWT